MEFVTLVAAVLALMTLPGTLELLFLTVGALLPPPKRKPAPPVAQRLVVIIPAHNEEITIQRTLDSLKKNQAKHDVVVVADNCTDRTAEIAAHAGARVLVRRDPENKGKSQALSYAFDKLLEESYTGFIIIDADTIARDNLITEVATAFQEGAEAIQTRDDVLNPGASLRTQLMNVGFLAFNYLRARGRYRWGLSAGVIANGFALSRKALQSIPYKEVDSVVEDLTYHLYLVNAGLRVDFLESTGVFAEMPISGQGVSTQRIRWEGGRLMAAFHWTPKLIKAITQGRWKLIEPLLDLLLPPLSYQATALLVLLSIPIPSARFYALFALGVEGSHLIAALALGGGSTKDVLALLAAPYYILWKWGLAIRTLVLRQNRGGWEKTERHPPRKDHIDDSSAGR